MGMSITYLALNIKLGIASAREIGIRFRAVFPVQPLPAASSPLYFVSACGLYSTVLSAARARGAPCNFCSARGPSLPARARPWHVRCTAPAHYYFAKRLVCRAWGVVVLFYWVRSGQFESSPIVLECDISSSLLHPCRCWAPSWHMPVRSPYCMEAKAIPFFFLFFSCLVRAAVGGLD